MIQRVQSIWLLLAAAAAALSLYFPFYVGSKLINDMSVIEDLNATQHPILLVLTVGVTLLSFVTLFLFKNRRLQLRMTIVALVLHLVNLVLYFRQMGDYSRGALTLTSVFAFAVPVFLLLAISGIRRDQNLIRSVDRLR